MILSVAGDTVQAWGAQGHRIVGLIAAAHLSPTARQNVAWLLPEASLADVANWADLQVGDVTQTAPWHYVNIPIAATAYDRDRDCPRQPNTSAGSRNDRWRDCIIDRIPYHLERVANTALDRADRATALKFLVHFVGDLHQPFHAIDTARGGNDIPVVVFGSPTCTRSDGSTFRCNLHGVWDTGLIGRRQLSDVQYVEALSSQIARHRALGTTPGAPQAWAMESLALARAAMLPPQGVVDEAYCRAQIAVIDERLVMGGLRLAAVLNQSLTTPPR
jgi:hypothetical protein